MVNEMLSVLQDAHPHFSALEFSEVLPSANFNNTIQLLKHPNGCVVCKSISADSDLNSLQWEYDLIAYLAATQSNLIFPVPLLNSEDNPYTVLEDSIIALYPFIEGKRPTYHLEEDIALFGEVTATLHSLLKDFPFADRPGRALFKEITSFSEVIKPTAKDLRVSNTSEISELLGFWADAYDELSDYVHGEYRDLPFQMCHNDVTVGNLLKSPDGRVAILDFEFACMTPKALDISWDFA